LAGGTWDILDLPKIPGLYMNFRAAALAAIQPGARGVVMVPVKAHWGPIETFTTITRESQAADLFTTNDTEGATAYKTLRFALMGGAKEVIAYRLDNGNAAAASLILSDTATPPAPAIQIEGYYKGERGNDFKITVAANPVDETKKDIKLYEGTTLKKVFTFPSGTIAAAVAAINNDGQRLIKASLLSEGNGILADVTSQPLEDGDSGIEEIANQKYLDAFEAMEAQKFNVVTLDGVTDAGLQASFKAWVQRLRSEGTHIIGVIGGSATVDKAADAVDQAVARSSASNYEGIVNVGCGGYLGGVEYSSAEVAAWVAGLIAGQKLKESTTYASAPFSDVNRRWTKTEMKTAVENGVFLLIHDGLIVKVLKGINSLVTLRQDQNNAFKKIRGIRVMDAIAEDLQRTAEANYIGKVNNTEEGRLALIGACMQYMATLAKGEVIENTGYFVQLDPNYYGEGATMTPEADQVFLNYGARLTDVMENIFGNFYVL
jgi:hypothetical protein